MANGAGSVLITGGAGYIGSHVAKAVAARGLIPVVYDNLSSGHAHAVRWGPLIEGDLRDETALGAALAAHRPVAVMHFAASIEVGEGEREPLRFYDNNVGGSLSLLRAMAKAGLDRIVFSSTCAVYGEPERLPLTEDQPRNPVNVYGRSKLVVERMLEDLSRAAGLRYVALRYFNAAGADPEGDIGEEHDPETHLIPNALKAAAGIGGPMRLNGEDYPTPDGTCVRDYIHVSDLAQAHLLALDRLSAKPGGLAVNVGTGAGVSIRQVLAAAEAATGRDVPYVSAPRRPGDAAALFADVTRARAELGFRAQRSDIASIVADAWRFHAPRWGVAG